MSEERLQLIGCGILQREIRRLIEKNHWPVDARFLDSSLHVDFDRLARGLRGALAKHHAARKIVFYGCCHPQMESILAEGQALRTQGQNCVEMLLGHECFTRELMAGAYFLMEDWALRWEEVLVASFGTDKWELIREIFQSDRKYLLGVTTPCSGDFRSAAEEAARLVGLPLRWLSADLQHLEAALNEVMQRQGGEASCLN